MFEQTVRRFGVVLFALQPACSSSAAQSDKALPQLPALCDTAPELVELAAGLEPANPCSAPLSPRCGIQVRDGTLYFCSVSAVCATDEDGTRALGSPELPWLTSATRFWVESERILIADGSRLSALALTSDGRSFAREIVGRPDVPPGVASVFTYDGQALYFASLVAQRGSTTFVSRWDLSDDTVQQSGSISDQSSASGVLMRSGHVDGMHAVGGRIDVTTLNVGHGATLWRFTPPSLRPELIASIADGALLVSDAHGSYVRAHRDAHARASEDAREYGFYRFDLEGRRVPVWNDSAGHLVPTAAMIDTGSVYVGGSALFSGAAPQLVVGRVEPDGVAPRVLGCMGEAGASDVVASIAIDEHWIHALVVDESGRNRPKLLRVPRPDADR